MFYIKSYKVFEKLEEFDYNEIFDIFIDVYDIGFKVEDIKIGKSTKLISKYPVRGFDRNAFEGVYKSITIRLIAINSININNIDIFNNLKKETSESINRLKTIYNLELGTIFYSNAYTTDYIWANSANSLFNSVKRNCNNTIPPTTKLEISMIIL